MNTAADRFRRLTVLLPQFAADDTQHLDTLAARLGVPAEVILEDLRALVDRYDDPPGYQETIGVHVDGDTVTVRTSHFLRPMRVTVAELCALELGLGILARESGDHATVLAALRAKLARCITRLPQDAAYDGLRHGALVAGHDGDGAVLDTLRRALRRSRVVTLGYQRPSDAEPDARDVRPYRLFFHHGCWYLAGYCEQVQGLRLFRTDRIVVAELTDRAHRVPEEFTLESIMVDGRPYVGPAAPAQLVIRYSPAIARWIAERDGQPLEPDGSAVRTMPLVDRDWAIRHVLQYGPDARIVAPQDLAAEVVERLQGM